MMDNSFIRDVYVYLYTQLLMELKRMRIRIHTRQTKYQKYRYHRMMVF